MDLAKPVQIDFLNFDDKLNDMPTNLFEVFTIFISLGNKVIIQKRIVYDYLMMFGDVGGLNDFIFLLLSSVFGFISNRLMLKALVERLFHFTDAETRSPTATLKHIKSLQVSTWIVMFKSFFGKRHTRSLKKAEAKLDDSFDVVRLIRLGRNFRTLIRLLLTRNERRLMRF